MTEVSVTTGARLHFGPLSVAAPGGGRFGGVGIMVARPCINLHARPASADSFHGDPEVSARVAEFVRRIRDEQPAEHRAPCEISVSAMIPSHCGFGSGTQLGLAVGRAVSLVANEPPLDLPTLAQRVQRGMRSAIGLYGFLYGGFLVDGGRLESNQLGTLVSRLDFPEAWRFVLAAPRKGIGLSGTAEQSAFARQPPMPLSLTSDLCRIVLMDWLPSVIEADFERCGESLYTYGHAVGEFFSPAQGGIFAHPRMAEWAGIVRERGIRGVAQTSWGPTLAALCSSESQALQLQKDFVSDAKWHDCTFDMVAPLNRGATIRVS